MMPNRLEPELDIYQYPEHLRTSLELLPKSPGVYLFHGLSDSMPLYIGKSINIRSRVMAHFRTQDEARLLRQTQRISFHETAGEVGALLLEAQLIKQQQPLFNKRLRRSKHFVHCIWIAVEWALYMPKTSILPPRSIFMGCLPTELPRWKSYGSSLMSSVCATVSWVLINCPSGAPVSVIAFENVLVPVAVSN